MRGLVVGRHVSGQTVEHGLEVREFSLGDASTEPLVERQRGSAPPLGEGLAGMSADLEAFRLRELKLVIAREWDCPFNWKVLVENYQECYHCPTIHPQLCDVSPPRSGENYTVAGAA